MRYLYILMLLYCHLHTQVKFCSLDDSITNMETDDRPPPIPPYNPSFSSQDWVEESHFGIGERHALHHERIQVHEHHMECIVNEIL